MGFASESIGQRISIEQAQYSNNCLLRNNTYHAHENIRRAVNHVLVENSMLR